MSYPNEQNNPAAAIPVWIASTTLPPGHVLIAYQQISDLSSAVPLPTVEGATMALVQPNTGVVRYRADGTSPTGTTGMILSGTQPFVISENLEFIQDDGDTSSINVEYYGPSA